MSKKTRINRIRNLQKRISGYESFAASCKGVHTAYGCQIGGKIIAPGCYKHCHHTAILYENAKKSLERIKRIHNNF